MPESLTPELRKLQTRVKSFIEEELQPLDEGLDGDPYAPIPDQVRKRVREASETRGLYGASLPSDVGGLEAGPLALVVIREALAEHNSRLAQFVLGPRLGALRAARGEARKRFLEPLVRGEKGTAFAFTEPSGADAPQRPTWAHRDGEELVITGRKSYVTNGGSADFFTVLVNVEEDDSGPGGAAMVVVERDTPGLSIVRTFASMEGGNHVELALDKVRAPISNVLGDIGQGMPRAMDTIGEERLEQAANAVGLTVWAVGLVTRHITGPHRSGKRLGDLEGVRLRYADMRIETYAARSMLYRTARLVDSGDAAINEVMATKVFCSEAAGRVIDQAVQLVGGQALVVGHPLEHAYRRVRSMRLSGGAADILRLGVARGAIEFEAGRL